MSEGINSACLINAGTSEKGIWSGCFGERRSFSGLSLSKESTALNRDLLVFRMFIIIIVPSQLFGTI